MVSKFWQLVLVYVSFNQIFSLENEASIYDCPNIFGRNQIKERKNFGINFNNLQSFGQGDDDPNDGEENEGNCNYDKEKLGFLIIACSLAGNHFLNLIAGVDKREDL